MATPVVTVVHASACHYCTDAEEALAELGRELPVRVESVSATSEPGAAMVREHRPPMLPLVLIDGEYFSHGRLPRRKLRRLLESRRSVILR